jgi:hypothetical protein
LRLLQSRSSLFGSVSVLQKEGKYLIMEKEIGIDKVIELIKSPIFRNVGIKAAETLTEMDDLEELCDCLNSLDRDKDLEKLLGESQAKLLIHKSRILN